MIQAAGVDLDGVMVESFTANPLPGVAEDLAFLEEIGMPFATITNQNGPPWRSLTGQEKYPTIDDLVKRFRLIIRALPILGRVPWYVSLCADPSFIRAMAKHLREPHDETFRSPEALERLATEEANKTCVAMAHSFQVGLDAHVRAGIFHVSADVSWRKPGTGMLKEAAAHFGVATQQMAFVDDMDSGRRAAEAAGCWYAPSLRHLVEHLRG